jgi:hypothetical protein
VVATVGVGLPEVRSASSGACVGLPAIVTGVVPESVAGEVTSPEWLGSGAGGGMGLVAAVGEG